MSRIWDGKTKVLACAFDCFERINSGIAGFFLDVSKSWRDWDWILLVGMPVQGFIAYIL